MRLRRIPLLSALLAGTLWLAQPAGADPTIAVSSVQTTSGACLFPQGTIDLFNVTINNADTTGTLTPLVFHVYLEGIGAGGIQATDFDTLQMRVQNTTNIVAANTIPVSIGLGAASVNALAFTPPISTIALGASRTYVLSVTLSDTISQGDEFRATVQGSRAVLFYSNSVLGDSLLIQPTDLLTQSVVACGVKAQNELPHGINGADPEPFLVGAGSDYFAVLGFTLASAKPLDQLQQVIFRWIDSGETFNFRPGHQNVAPNPEFGDLRDVSLWKDADGDGRFSPTADLLLRQRSRKRLFVGDVSDPALDDDAGTVELDTDVWADTPLTNVGRALAFIDTPVYRYSWAYKTTGTAAVPFLLPSSLTLSQQATNRSNYFIACRTNDAGFGEAGGLPADNLPPGFVGFGDEWRMQLESVSIRERRFIGTGVFEDVIRTLRFAIPENAVNTDTPSRAAINSETVTEIAHHPRWNAGFFDYYFDESPSGELERTDGSDLDFVGQPVGRIYALGGPANANFGERIHAVNIEFRDSYGLFAGHGVVGAPAGVRDLRNNFRAIGGNSGDGIQIWRNGDDGPNLNEPTDFNLPLDPFNSSWQVPPGVTGVSSGIPGVWRFRAVLNSPHVLPSDTGSGDGFLRIDNGVILNPQYWIVMLSSKTANPNDHVFLRIPDGGIEFSSGSLNGYKSSDAIHAAVLGRSNQNLRWNAPLVWTDFTTTGQLVSQSSPPTAVLGMNLRGGGPGNAGDFEASYGDPDIHLSRMTVYLLDQGLTPPNLAQGDFLPFSNDTEAVPGAPRPLLRSGFAVYRDNDGAAGNRNGLFDPGIDIPLFTRDVFSPPAPETGTGWVSVGAVPNALRLQIVFADTETANRLPGDDSGTNAGPDYFLVLRTSSSISSEDRFRVVVGDLNLSDGIRSNLAFRNDLYPSDLDSGGLRNPVLYSLGYPFLTLPFIPFLSSSASEPSQEEFSAFMGATMRTEQLTVGTISSSTLVDLIPPSFTIDREEQFAAIGINMLDGTSANITLDQITVDVIDSGGFQATSDLFSMSNQATAGIALYIDTGVKGVFDTADIRVSVDNLTALTTLVPGAPSGSRRYLLRPSTPIPVPDDDTSSANAGIDLFVVLKTSATIQYADSFYVSVPESGLIYSSPTQNTNDTFPSSLITAKVNASIIDYTLAPTDTATPGVKKLVFGINANDQLSSGGDGGVILTEIRTLLYPDTSFSLADLFSSIVFPQPGSDTSGVALFRDNGTTNGVFDAADSFIATSINWVGGPPYDLRITPTSSSDSTVPTGDAGADSGPDFFIVINLSSTTLNGDAFHMEVPINGVSFSAAASRLTEISSPIVVTGATSQTEFLPSRIWSPNGNGSRETVAVRAQVTLNSADTRSMILVVYNRALSTGETALVRFGAGTDTTFVLTGADLLNLPSTTDSSWAQREYGVRIFYSDAGSTSAIDISALLIVDSEAVSPNASVPSASTSSNVTQVTVAPGLGTPSPSGDFNLDSSRRARQASENNEGFGVHIRVTSTTTGESALIVTGDTQGPLSTFSKTYNVTLFTGNNVIAVTLTDLSGNSTTETLTISAAGTTAAAARDITYEGGAPIFRYTPSNPEYTFTLAGPAQSGGIEIHSQGGDRLRGVQVTPGSALISWDARNTAGGLVRNGIYLVRFRIQLSDGRTIESVRPIFLLK